MAWFLLNLLLLSVFAGLGGPSAGLRPVRVALGRVPAAQAAESAPALPPPKKIVPDSLGVEVTAPSAALIDAKTGALLFAQGQDRIAPIASITKLLTALVFLDANPGWDKKITIAPEDGDFGGLPYLKTGDVMTVRDVFETALAGSVNTGAAALARATGMSREQFVAKMNSKAVRLGMTHSAFVDPTGYGSGNVSTVFDVARLAYAAFDRPDVREALTRKEYDFKTGGGQDRRIPATDTLLDSFLNQGDYQIVGGKTGYTDEAAYTLVVRATRGKGDVIAIALGSASADARFQDVKSLLAWGFRTYRWQ